MPKRSLLAFLAVPFAMLAGAPAHAVTPVLAPEIESCRAAFAARLDLPVTAIRYDSRDLGEGFTIIFVSARDGRRQGYCRIETATGQVSVEVLR